MTRCHRHGREADTPEHLLAVVNAYQAILNSANGTQPDTAPALTVAQYGGVGVQIDGVTGAVGNPNTTVPAYMTYYSLATPLTLGTSFAMSHQGSGYVKGENYTFSSPDGTRLLLNDMGGFFVPDGRIAGG